MKYTYIKPILAEFFELFNIFYELLLQYFNKLLINYLLNSSIFGIYYFFRHDLIFVKDNKNLVAATCKVRNRMANFDQVYSCQSLRTKENFNGYFFIQIGKPMLLF